MPWIKIDDHFDEHPKLLKVGPLGWGYWLAGLAYCNRNLTDGFIPWTKARRLASFEIAEDDGRIWDLGRMSGHAGDDIDADWVIGLLVDAGLWEIVENDRGGIDGFIIHDYEDYQPTKEAVEDVRQKRAEAGRKGGLAKAKQSASKVLSKPPSKTEAKVYPVPVPDPVPKEEKDKQPKNLAPVSARTRDPDLLFEAIAEAWKGEPYHADLLTGSQSSLVGKAATDIRKVDGRPDEVPREWASLRERFDNPTPAALAKHWGTNGTGPKRTESKNDTTRNAVNEYIAGNSESSGGGDWLGVDADGDGADERRPERLGSGMVEIPDGRAWRDGG